MNNEVEAFYNFARHCELEEGAATLANLLKGYSESTQKLVISLIKPGNKTETLDQFYDIMYNLSDGKKAESEMLEDFSEL